MKTDNATLTRLVEQCFDCSMDGRFSPAQQTNFLALGKRLRGCLVNLLSATFNDGTPQVVAANRAIAANNKALNGAVQTLGKAGQILKNLDQLVGTLDGLLKLATGFQ